MEVIQTEKYKKAARICLQLLGIVILIFSSETARRGALEGIDLCLHTLIPSLFPIMVLTSSFLKTAQSMPIPLMKTLRKICKIPLESENILISGLLGGYPIGAKLTAISYENGSIEKPDAQRMLAFCNNAGPAFIFGVISHVFSSVAIPLTLWVIHILSAIVTGCLIPGTSKTAKRLPRANNNDKQPLMNHCVNTMGIICGWVILFRIIIAYFHQIIPNHSSPEIIVIIAGLLELTNGCTLLHTIANPAVRFLICNGLITFGGLCVTMQTTEIAHTVGLKYYLPGKLLQTSISMLISLFLQIPLFHISIPLKYAVTLTLICIFIMAMVMYRFYWKKQ